MEDLDAAKQIAVLDQFKEDDVFQQFLHEDLDVRTFASAAIQSIAVTEQLSKLSTGITLLDKELHDQVSNHYEDLLSQATEVETLEEVLPMMHNRIQMLMLAAERLHSKIVEPFNRVVNQTLMLSRLQSTCDLLRRAVRILALSRRLQEQLAEGPQGIHKAANSINELDYLMEGVSLLDVSFLEKDLTIIQNARKTVVKQAHVMLEKGMENLNQSQVGTALQVFFNLGILVSTVKDTVTQTTQGLQENTAALLDVATQIRANAPHFAGGPGKASGMFIDTATFKAHLWANVVKLMDDIHSACSKIHHLQKVLGKKRDPVTHVLFSEELLKAGENNIMQCFWDEVTTILTKSFSKASQKSSQTRQSFEGEYPKVLRHYLDLWKQLEQFNCFLNSKHHKATIDFNNEQLSTDTYDPEEKLRNALLGFEKVFLSNTRLKLLDLVNVAFPDGGRDAPSQADVENVIYHVTNDMKTANVDGRLSQSVAQCVAETINLFVTKSEALLPKDEDSTQVMGPAKSSQILTADVVRRLVFLNNQMKEFLNGTSAPCIEAATIIKDALQGLEYLIEIAIEPLLSAITSAIENIVLTMHQEKFSGFPSDDDTKDVNSANAMQQCSAYMKELQSFIDRADREYFAIFPDYPLIQKRIQHVAGRSLEFFLRHCSLVRPLSQKGKMKLTADCAQLEMGLGPLCQRLGDLGKPYRMLRSFRPLLFQTPQHIAQSPVVGDILPYSIVLLFLFSRGPPELKSPHEASGWSIEQYSKWLDENPSEKERLSLIRCTLEAYVQWVKKKNIQEFCPVYPVMIDLLQKALKTET